MGYGKLERALGHSIGPLGASHLLGAALASTVLLIAGCGSVDSEERAHELGTVVQRALLGECESRIYQAEEMVHTTGEGTSDGWNLWSNGSSSVNHTFVTAQTTIVVRARGSAAAGVWPQMAVSVGGVQVGSVFVSTSSYAEYSFTFASTAGVQPLQISFTNDAYQNGEDRNLYLDWLSVECDATGEPSCSDGLYNGDEVGVDCGGSCAPCAACSPASHEAEGISATTGGATSDGWNIWSNGSIYTVHHFVSPATVEVVARGSYAGGGWPIMEVSVGGSVVGTATVASDVYGTYGFDYSGPLGSQELRVRFTNDYYQRPDDRNLYVDRVDITCPTECPSGSEGQPCSGGFCDANGECVECLSATDCDDGNECTSDACSGGTCNAVPTAGSSCQVGAGVCDAFGGCVEPASCDLGLTGPGIIDGDYVVDQVDTATDLAGLADVWCVTGNLSIKSTSLATLDDLSGLVAVGRNLWVFSNPDLVALTGLENLRRVYRLDVQQNAHIQDLNALQDLSATAVNVGNNAALSSLVGLSGVQGWLQALSVSQCPSLLTLEGLEGITEVNTLSISNNTNLQSLSALGGLTRVEFDALFINNDALNNLAGLESLAKVGRDFRVSQSENLASISQLTSLTDFGQWGGELLFFDNPRLPECEVQSLAGTLAASCANCSGNLLCDDGNECTSDACSGGTCNAVPTAGSSCQVGAGVCDAFGGCVEPASCDLGLTGPGIIDGDYVVDQVDTATDLAGLADVWCVTGNLSIKSTSLATLDDLSGLVAVGRNLWVFSNPDLVALTGLENLRRVYRLDVQQNAHIQDLNALQDLSATAVNVGNNAALSSLVGLSGVQGWLQALSVSQCPSLLTLEGLEGITEVNTLSISNNTNLQSLSALGGLTRVEFDALFINNDALNNLAGLESLAKVGRDFRVSQSENLASISQLTSLTDFGQWGGELLFFDNPRLPECEVQSLAGTLAASCANCSGNLLCDDGSECTTGACNGAACEHTHIVGSSCAAGGLCNEAGACVDCLDASDCADGDVCNGEESCDGSGSCVSGPPLDCSDGEECTADSCEPGLGCQNPIAVGQECSVGICSEFGACVECLEDSDCGAEEALALCDEAGSCQVLDCTPGASGPGIVDGTVIVDGEDTAGDLALLEGASCVTGDLYVTETLLTDLTGLSALRAVAGDFTIGGVIPGCTKYPCASGNKALVSLAGLENLQSVRGEFEVDHSPIRSLAALTALRHVGKIIVSDTAVQDLRGLEGLQHVAGSVGIYTNTQLTSVSGLDNLETVGQVVSLYGNRRLRSIAALGSLGSIGKSLGIFNSALTNLEGLESLTTVSSLGLHLNSSLVDIGALANLLVVDNLSLVNSPNLADLSVLGSITRLDELLLGDLGITNLSALQSLQQVGGLYVYDNAHLTSLDGLSALDSAPTVYIERNPVLVDVAAISHVPLELLIWSGNASITSLPALGYHSQSSLWIGEPEQPQALTDLAGLAGVTSIAALDLSATDSLNSLLGAESLTSIGRLSIQRCPNLTSLRGLENLQTLESLWVQANPDLTSLAALQSITALRELHVEYNPELESLAGLDALGPGSVGSMWIFGNASLPQCEVDAFVLGLDRWCDDCCCNDATSVCE